MGNELETRVMNVGIELARRLGAELDVLSVVSAGLQGLDAMETRSQLDRFDYPISVRMIVDDGDVVGDVLREIGDQPTLMCLATDARTPLGEAVFGSVAADVIRRCPTAIVVVGPHCNRALDGTTVAVALDGSRASEVVVGPALDVAAGLGLDVQLVEVLSGSGLGEWSRRAEFLYLSGVVQEYRQVSSIAEPMLVAGSRIDDALIALSADPNIAMLAMGTHAIGRFERLVAGSITLDVVRKAYCPVLIQAQAGTQW